MVNKTSRSRAKGLLPGVLSGALAVGAFGLAASVAVVLLLSDRAPRFGAQVKDFILQVGTAFESAFGVNWIDRDSVPGTFDQIGHAALWCGVMVLLGLAFRRWVPALVTAFFVLCASASLEVLQGSLTTTRAVESKDAFANGVGIAFGLLLVLTMGFLFDLVSSLRRKLGSDGGQSLDERAHAS